MRTITMNNTQKRIKFLKMFAAFTGMAAASDIDFIVTCFYRSAEEQNKRFNEGKSYCDGYTKKSKHQKWLAIDIVIIDETSQCIWARVPEYERVGQLWKDLGGTWGGDWESLNDVYHLEWDE